MVILLLLLFYLWTTCSAFSQCPPVVKSAPDPTSFLYAASSSPFASFRVSNRGRRKVILKYAPASISSQALLSVMGLDAIAERTGSQTGLHPGASAGQAKLRVWEADLLPSLDAEPKQKRTRPRSGWVITPAPLADKRDEKPSVHVHVSGNITMEEALENLRGGVRRGRGRLDGKAARLRMLPQKGLSKLQEAAAARGGRLVSQTYMGVHSKYTFKCAQGHEWTTRGTRVLFDKTWCRHCHIEDTRLHDGLQRLEQAAIERGGTLLSQNYTGMTRKYDFRCGRGHQWSASAMNILRGTWCPSCCKPKPRLAHDGMERIKTTVESHGGKLHNETFNGMSRKYLFECGRGHQWLATAKNVVQGGSWCPRCSKPGPQFAKDGLERLQQAAVAKGGKLLSQTFTGCSQQYQFECRRGHQWSTRGSKVLYSGTWCRRCFHQDRRQWPPTRPRTRKPS